jgi:hypothetical protein
MAKEKRKAGRKRLLPGKKKVGLQIWVETEKVLMMGGGEPIKVAEENTEAILAALLEAHFASLPEEQTP